MIFKKEESPFELAYLNELYLADERTCVETLLPEAEFIGEAANRVRGLAERLVTAVRTNRVKDGGLDAFLQEYDLSSKEGVVLMCLAEALLRIPDADTADALIKDKITEADWRGHLGATDSLFVNASTWGLMLTGQLVGDDPDQDVGAFLKRLVARAGEPVVRSAMRQAMKIMGHQYVMGRTIEEALKRSEKKQSHAYRYSFDMLGEAALTQADADNYFEAYQGAISALGKHNGDDSILTVDSISIKLSALHPRYEFSQRQRVFSELVPLVLKLAVQAKGLGVAVTIDAEEADRLEVSLELFKRVFEDPQLKAWNGLGLALQTYQKRARSVVDWLIELAKQNKKQIPLRLVKGAYWDTEIKVAQTEGLEGYPVFTRKSSTDVSYLACARRVLEVPDYIYPQFATHNARTLAAIIEMAGPNNREYEFQRLHGMGEELYNEVVGSDKMDKACRVYAPVGAHKDLLPYLVRRLLENGANSSFVNRITDETVPLSDMVEDPAEITRGFECTPHPSIALSLRIYGDSRDNSQGINFYNSSKLQTLGSDMCDASQAQQFASSIIGGKWLTEKKASKAKLELHVCYNPAAHSEQIGSVVYARSDEVTAAIDKACIAQPSWDRTPAGERADCLRKAADLYQQHGAELMALCVKEAGKTLDDAISELREAVDFLRYYADQAEINFSDRTLMPGPTGESNELSLHGRGVFVCISPWNFPLAIFTGQVSGALAAGNAVLAKPAEQTPLIAFRAVQLLLEAGIPNDVLQLLLGTGAEVGAQAVADPRIAGVAFTGSTQTASLINLSLAQRQGPIATLVAETGGQNAMLVDSSALPEQVVTDVLSSAFKSAGQRCSALRVLCLQEEIAPRVIKLLKGALSEMVVGNPAFLSSDIGPVIDSQALKKLELHVTEFQEKAEWVYRVPLADLPDEGTFMQPTIIAINDIAMLEQEVFGPVLHIVTYRSDKLDDLIGQINQLNFGLTLGIHTRVGARAEYIHQRVRAGNSYVNRNMIGAVVGTQPFGGCNLSGTGPKAGGPHYLTRFAVERTLTINTTAVGGNASLLSMD